VKYHIVMRVQQLPGSRRSRKIFNICQKCGNKINRANNGNCPRKKGGKNAGQKLGNRKTQRVIGQQARGIFPHWEKNKI